MKYDAQSLWLFDEWFHGVSYIFHLYPKISIGQSYKIKHGENVSIRLL